MNESKHHPDDPLFLVSRSLDEELSADERRRLEELLSGSAELRGEARQLEAVDAAVRGLGREAVEIDWKHHWELIDSRVRSTKTDEAELGQVDRLVKAWGSRLPVHDEEEFAESVLARIASARRERRIARRTIRIGAPLAAAAVIVIAVTASFWSVPASAPVMVVSIGPAASTMVAAAEPRVVVSFGRSGVSDRGTETASGIGFMTMGASPLSQSVEEAAPL